MHGKGSGHRATCHERLRRRSDGVGKWFGAVTSGYCKCRWRWAGGERKEAASQAKGPRGALSPLPMHPAGGRGWDGIGTLLGFHGAATEAPVRARRDAQRCTASQLSPQRSACRRPSAPEPPSLMIGVILLPPPRALLPSTPLTRLLLRDPRGGGQGLELTHPPTHPPFNPPTSTHTPWGGGGSYTFARRQSESRGHKK